jgi:hypothetical protein
MKRPGTPILFSLYDKKDEEIKSFSRVTVPWGLMKKAIKLSEEIDLEHPTEDDVDAMAGLVCELYGNDLTVQEIDASGDTQDVVSVITAIVSKAAAVMPKSENPTPPAGKKRH